ncbi:UNVERIFIED_CONTAM: hypothetical protein FKN15_055698 [Acipenser sinensis]
MEQSKDHPDQKSPSPSLGNEAMSPAGLAGVTSQHPDKELVMRIKPLPQLIVEREVSQDAGGLFKRRKSRRVHPQPSKQPSNEQQLTSEKGKGCGCFTRFFKKKWTEVKKMKRCGRCCWCFCM